MRKLGAVALGVVVVVGVSCSLEASGPGVQPLDSPDSMLPTAGICGDALPGETAIIRLNVDTPNPRCAKVTANQRLHVTNLTDSPVTVVLMGVDYEIAQGAGTTFAPMFGDIWEPGVHVLHTSAYGDGGGPEIWLLADDPVD